MLTVVLELDAGTNDVLAYGGSDQQLAGWGKIAHSFGDVDGETSDVGAPHLDVIGVDARPQVQADALRLPQDLLGALQGSASGVEGGQETLTGGLNLPTWDDFPTGVAAYAWAIDTARGHAPRDDAGSP